MKKLFGYVIAIPVAALITWGLFGTMANAVRVNELSFMHIKVPDIICIACNKKRPPCLNCEIENPESLAHKIKLNNVAVSDLCNLNDQMRKANSPAFLIKTSPKYPENATNEAMEGSLIVEFVVTKYGHTKDIRVISSELEETFHNAAIKTVKNWEYLPSFMNGEPVEITCVRERIDFVLDK